MITKATLWCVIVEMKHLNRIKYHLLLLYLIPVVFQINNGNCSLLLQTAHRMKQIFLSHFESLSHLDQKQLISRHQLIGIIDKNYVLLPSVQSTYVPPGFISKHRFFQKYCYVFKHCCTYFFQLIMLNAFLPLHAYFTIRERNTTKERLI